jgi:hypothetical protein
MTISECIGNDKTIPKLFTTSYLFLNDVRSKPVIDDGQGRSVERKDRANPKY